jgi:parvulin-like peptidyl-prolyl isomerase
MINQQTPGNHTQALDVLLSADRGVGPDEASLQVWEDEVDVQEELRAQRRRRNMVIIAIILALGIGTGIGFAVARQRYRAQKIIVSINGQIITQDDFVHRMELATGSQTLNRMADEMLQYQYARKVGVVVPDSEVMERYHELNARPNFAQYMADTHQDSADMINQIRLEMIVDKIIDREVKVTAEDINRYYAKNIDSANPNARFYTPPRVTIAVIASSNKDRVFKAKQEIDRGQGFDAVAATYSDDLTSRDHGGQLPPITKGRTLTSKIPGMEKVLFNLKTGETVGPIAFGNTWEIIRCITQEPEVVRKQSEVAYECRVGALLDKLPKSTSARLRSDYIKFQQSANIHTFRPEYKMVFGGR